jgi:hypothetical protein
VFFDFLFALIPADHFSYVLPVTKAFPLKTLHEQEFFFSSPILNEKWEI